MYEIYRRSNNGKIRFVGEFEHLSMLLRQFTYESNITCNFGYSDVGRRAYSHTLFTEEQHSPSLNKDTSYRYILLKNGNVVAPDYLVGKWREYKKEHSRPTFEQAWRKKARGRKRRCSAGYRSPRTTQERTWANAWDDEEYATPCRQRRNATNLVTNYDDISRHIDKSWKIQSKREHQWKPKNER